jgi:hypothetical protein
MSNIESKVGYGDTIAKDAKTTDLLSRVAMFLPAIRTSNEALLVDIGTSCKRQKNVRVDSSLKPVESHLLDACDDDDENIHNESQLEEVLVTDSASVEEECNKESTVVMHLAMGKLDENPAIEMLATSTDVVDDPNRDDEPEEKGVLPHHEQRILNVVIPSDRKCILKERPLITELD